MFRFKRGNCLSVFKIVKKELMCHIANLLVLFLILQSIIMCSVCSFFTISYIRVFHRLKRNIFIRNSIKGCEYLHRFLRSWQAGRKPNSKSVVMVLVGIKLNFTLMVLDNTVTDRQINSVFLALLSIWARRIKNVAV